ncbi:MAG: hypothetical protein JWP14_3370 [Frankiales bacterium]|nr:hypothetical protein [Frankiales bacterium]
MTSPFPDGLLINGTDLESLFDVLDYSQLRAPGTKRGSNLTYPNVDGDTHVDKVYASYNFDIPVALSGDAPTGTELERRAAFNAALDAAAAVLDNGLLVMTRRLAKVGGGYDETTADGEYNAGLAVKMGNPLAGTTVLSFVNLTGCWLDGSGGKHL